MGKMQREKGKRFERAIAARFRELWPDAIVRRASQAERADNPDVFVEGGPAILGRLWLELQDAREPTPRAKLEQAETDVFRWQAERRIERMQRLPVVIWHRLAAREIHATMRLYVLDEIRSARVEAAGDDVVTMSLDSLLRLLRDAEVTAKEAA